MAIKNCYEATNDIVTATVDDCIELSNGTIVKRSDFINQGITDLGSDSSSRYREWLLTVPAHKFDEDYIIKILNDYRFIGQLERGTKITQSNQQGYLHWQIFISNKNPIRFSTLANKFDGQAHIEVARNGLACFLYVQKLATSEGLHIQNGDWSDYGPNKMRVEDLIRYKMLSENISKKEVLATVSGSGRFMGLINDLEEQRLNLIFEEMDDYNPDMNVIYIYGHSKTGKTSTLRRLYSGRDGMADDFYVVKCNSQHPFDRYDGQRVLIFDEFYSSFKFDDCLQLFDKYKMQVDARFHNKYLMHDTLFVVSNVRLEEQFVQIKQADLHRWSAFLRRFMDKVFYMDHNGFFWNESERYKQWFADIERGIAGVSPDKGIKGVPCDLDAFEAKITDDMTPEHLLRVDRFLSTGSSFSNDAHHVDIYV